MKLITNWQFYSFAERIIRLPPHPNIVAMYNSFVDYIPDLPGSRKLYPDALPSRINPDGYGRNMSLFLLMKRYDTNLRDYINNTNTEIRDKILILTQILEGVSHMNRHNVAHRDLKSDNILLETVGKWLYVFFLINLPSQLAPKLSFKIMKILLRGESGMERYLVMRPDYIGFC